MLLADIFKPTIFRIAEAPQIGSDQPLGLFDPNILNQLEDTKQNIEGFPLFAKRFGDQFVFAIKDRQQNVLSVLIAAQVDDFPSNDNRETIHVQRSWTPPESRRKGYSRALYYGLARLRYRILSDTQQSSAAFQMWQSVKQETPDRVKLFDLTTQEYTNENPEDNKNILFVLEATTRNQNADSILEDNKYFTEI